MNSLSTKNSFFFPDKLWFWWQITSSKLKDRMIKIVFSRRFEYGIHSLTLPKICACINAPGCESEKKRIDKEKWKFKAFGHIRRFLFWLGGLSFLDLIKKIYIYILFYFLILSFKVSKKKKKWRLKIVCEFCHPVPSPTTAIPFPFAHLWELIRVVSFLNFFQSPLLINLIFILKNKIIIIIWIFPSQLKFLAPS